MSKRTYWFYTCVSQKDSKLIFRQAIYMGYFPRLIEQLKETNEVILCVSEIPKTEFKKIERFSLTPDPAKESIDE